LFDYNAVALPNSAWNINSFQLVNDGRKLTISLALLGDLQLLDCRIDITQVGPDPIFRTDPSNPTPCLLSLSETLTYDPVDLIPSPSSFHSLLSSSAGVSAAYKSMSTLSLILMPVLSPLSATLLERLGNMLEVLLYLNGPRVILPDLLLTTFSTDLLPYPLPNPFLTQSQRLEMMRGEEEIDEWSGEDGFYGRSERSGVLPRKYAVRGVSRLFMGNFGSQLLVIIIILVICAIVELIHYLHFKKLQKFSPATAIKTASSSKINNEYGVKPNEQPIENSEAKKSKTLLHMLGNFIRENYRLPFLLVVLEGCSLKIIGYCFLAFRTDSPFGVIAASVVLIFYVGFAICTVIYLLKFRKMFSEKYKNRKIEEKNDSARKISFFGTPTKNRSTVGVNESTIKDSSELKLKPGFAKGDPQAVSLKELESPTGSPRNLPHSPSSQIISPDQNPSTQTQLGIKGCLNSLHDCQLIEKQEDELRDKASTIPFGELLFWTNSASSDPCRLSSSGVVVLTLLKSIILQAGVVGLADRGRGQLYWVIIVETTSLLAGVFPPVLKQPNPPPLLLDDASRQLPVLHQSSCTTRRNLHSSFNTYHISCHTKFSLHTLDSNFNFNIQTTPTVLREKTH